MRTAALILGLLCCASTLIDAFQTIILPRRPVGRFRVTKIFYIATWTPWSALTRHIQRPKVREQIYSIYGPVSLLLLLVVWAFLLVAGFGCLFFALGTPFLDALSTGSALSQFRTDLYVSGTTLFTLGLGDVVPHALAARALIIAESATGLGLVALVIGYVPVLYGAFSHREIAVALLDARAGSPPTATELLRRHAFDGGHATLSELLAEWERWAAEILESHISYPILCYYRSQHDNQSWLAALTAILDTCALLISIVPGPASRQAQLTFAIGRHALVDLGHVFRLEREEIVWRARGGPARLSPDNFQQVCDLLLKANLSLCGDPQAPARLHALRELYEPGAQALADYLGLTLPDWYPKDNAKDQWKIVEGVRSQAAASLVDTSVLSPNALAVRLHGEDHL